MNHLWPLKHFTALNQVQDNFSSFVQSCVFALHLKLSSQQTSDIKTQQAVAIMLFLTFSI